MHRYFIKIPWIIKRFFSSYVWSIPTEQKEVFLTFDDGPHPQVTIWVLEELKKYNALATFFCIGDNVLQYPDVYARVIADGHAVGNHTQHHVNGWKVTTDVYIKDVKEATQYIDSSLFRPPYGRIRKSQALRIKEALRKQNVKIIMWDVLSADFDIAFSPEQCFQNVIRNVSAGSVIVFHDSEKAAPNLKYALPKVLEALSRAGYRFSPIK
jgi:peptidoglycan/xylan/chitin deacetylase (PgdA/CDA1 family)